MCDLTVFCATEPTRYSLESPFVVDGYKYFSNGVICIKYPTEEDNSTDKKPDFEACFADANVLQLDLAIPISDPAFSDIKCSKCNGTGLSHQKCSPCSGSGEHECDCGTYHECGFCDGDGVVDDYTGDMCRYCEGERREFADTEIGGALFNGYYIGLICKNLSNAKAVSFSSNALSEKDTGPMRFTFDGGEGVLMSIKKH